MESVSLITRLVIAVSLVLSAVFSVVAAMGFAGRSTTKTAGTSATSGGAGSSSSVRIALPPKGGDQGSGITPPVAPPVSQPIVQAPPVTSGGS